MRPQIQEVAAVAGSAVAAPGPAPSPDAKAAPLMQSAMPLTQQWLAQQL